MAVPWLAAIGVEYAVFGRFFASDLNAGDLNMRPRRDRGRADRDGNTALPVFTVIVVALTLAGFVGASAAGVNPAWAAFAGAAVLAARALARRRVAPASLLRAADLPFLLFVLSLGIVVKAVTDNGLGRVLAPLLPGGTSLPALLATAALAAVLANVCNNLRAVLVLLPLAAPSGPGAVLAVLLGVNIGPNLTYTGSLATLLWRRILRHHGSSPDLGEFTRLGLLTAPAGLVMGCWRCGPGYMSLEVSTLTDSDTQLRSVYIWVGEGTWRASVDAALSLAPAGARFTLLHVTSADVPDAARSAYAGLLGRGHRAGTTPGPGWRRWPPPPPATC